MSNIDVDEFIDRREKVVDEIRRRLDEIVSLAENATLILSKKEFKSIDLPVVETIVRLIDFKFKSVYSNTDFIEIVAVDTKLWRDVKRKIIDNMNEIIENIGSVFAKLDATMRVPEIMHEEDRYTVVDLKGQLRDLFSDLHKKIREIGKFTPEIMSREELEKKLKEIYG